MRSSTWAVAAIVLIPTVLPGIARSQNNLFHWSRTSYCGVKNYDLKYSGGGSVRVQWDQNLDQQEEAPYELIRTWIDDYSTYLEAGVEYWMPEQYAPEQAWPASVNSYIQCDFYAVDDSGAVGFYYWWGSCRATLDGHDVVPPDYGPGPMWVPVTRGWHRLSLRAGSGASYSSFISGLISASVECASPVTLDGVTEGSGLRAGWDFWEMTSGQAEFLFGDVGEGSIHQLEFTVEGMIAVDAPAGWESTYDPDTGLITLTAMGDPLDPGEEMTVQVTFDTVDKVAVPQPMQFVGAAGSGSLEDVPAIISVPVPPPGDANLDGVVSDADYTIWADHYGETNGSFATGDSNGDWEVTDADYTIWADNYGTGVNSVPDPSALVLLGTGVVALLGHRRVT